MHGLDHLPGLTAGNYTITSPFTPNYNCVSHAVHEANISLWPDDDNSWPVTVARVETVAAFVEMFRQIGFVEIPITATSPAAGYEKIAIFAVESDHPTHVARQRDTGRWTSKLGTMVDIDHADLGCLEGGEYGFVVRLMQRLHGGKRPKLPPLHPARPLIIRP